VLSAIDPAIGLSRDRAIGAYLSAIGLLIGHLAIERTIWRLSYQ
jgi:hypothetical protein